MNVEKVKNEIELAINTMWERQTPQSKNSFQTVETVSQNLKYLGWNKNLSFTHFINWKTVNLSLKILKKINYNLLKIHIQLKKANCVYLQILYEQYNITHEETNFVFKNSAFREHEPKRFYD